MTSSMNFFTLGFSRGDFLRGEIFFNLHQEFFEEFWLFFFPEINALAIFEKWMFPAVGIQDPIAPADT